MTSIKIFLWTTLCFCLAFHSSISGQNRLSEAEVNLQKIFIDANREKVLGNFENAEYLYKEVLSQDKNNHAAAYELARVYEAVEEEQKALKYIKEALEITPKNSWYQQFLADIYQKLGKNEEAALVYEDLVEQEPNKEYYYFKWAYFLVRANEINKAVKVYDELEAKIGINEEIIRRKHSLYLGTGNHKKAAKELQQLVDAFPDNLEYQHLLAGFYEQIGDQDAAKVIYEQILKADPDDVKAKLAITSANFEGNSDVQQLKALQPLFEKPTINIDEKIAQLIPFIAKVVESGDPQIAAAAVELTDILEQVHPDEAKGFSAAGDLLYYAGQPQKALAKYLKTIELDDSVFLVWEQAMYIYLENKDYKTLADFSEEAIDLFPNQAVAYYMNGMALQELQQYEDALDALNTALLISGRNGRLKHDIYLAQGATYRNLKEYSAGITSYEKALELADKSPEALNGYSLLLLEQGQQLEKSKAMADLANEILPGQYRYQSTRGRVAYKMKSYQEAKTWLEKALKNGGDKDPNVLEQYGDLLFQEKETERAIEYWKKALDQGSLSDVLEKKIADKQLYE